MPIVLASLISITLVAAVIAMVWHEKVPTLSVALYAFMSVTAWFVTYLMTSVILFGGFVL